MTYTPLRLLPLFAALCAALSAPPAAADDWAVVMRDRDRKVEIDRATIIQSDGGTKVAWGRVVMSPAEARKAGYTTVKALNRYDCNNRGFFTIKRVYLDDDNLVLREETVVDQSVVMVARNSVDERMWREVCRPPSVQDLARVAEQADRAAAGATPAPSTPPVREPVRQADYKPGGEGVDVIERTIASRPVPAPTAAAEPMPRQTAPVAAAPARPPQAQQAAAAPRPRAAAGAQGSDTAHTAARAQAPSESRGEVRWSYQGGTGPEQWGSLRPDWSACAQGRRQSPIDLRDGIGVALEPVRFDFRQTRFRVGDTGHTLSVRVGEGMGMEVRGDRYELESFQYHRPSEVRIDGRASDMAMHFHLRSLEGRRAVLVVLLERGERANPVLQSVLNNLPLERGAHFMPAEIIDLATQVPDEPAHFLFMGSLSQPPCTEDVLWVVMKRPLPVSDNQLAIFSRLYERNARPVQPLNDRLVLESR